jgi:glycosyltransferase involved in cell wall biosynthesis
MFRSFVMKGAFYLIIFQDDLLASVPHIRHDFLSTGRSITPHINEAPLSRFALCWHIVTLLIRLLMRRYDVVFFPAVALQWAADNEAFKAKVRNWLHFVIHHHPSSLAVFFRVLIGNKTKVAILDRYDGVDVYAEIARATNAVTYFKTNLRGEAARQNSLPNTTFKFLPYWIALAVYADKPVKLEDKKYDLFISFTVNSAARRTAMKALELLRNTGINIFHSQRCLEHCEYAAALRASWLVLSPEGYGFHGFRHYESMAMGAVPVVNRPSTDLITDLEDGVNCLMYNGGDPLDLIRVVKQALDRKEHLLEWGNQLRNYAQRHHTPRSVGEYLIKKT